MKRLPFIILLALLLLPGMALADTSYASYLGHFRSVNGSTTYEMFNTTGAANFTVPTGVSCINWFAVGGGGGGGGSAGSGGGAGGIRNGTLCGLVVGANLSINVGDGGAGGLTGYNHNGTSGGNTSFAGNISVGGGGGGAYNSISGLNGGSGGGGPYSVSGGFGVGIIGQGHDGGNSGGGTFSTGGGGGLTAGGAGSGGETVGGNGGAGLYNDSAGYMMNYSYGGGGFGSVTPGTGRSLTQGGGGTAGHLAGYNAINGFGDGGGGGSNDVGAGAGGKGGSGVVIVKYSIVTTPVTSFLMTNVTPVLSSSATLISGYSPTNVSFMNTTAINGTETLSWKYTPISTGVPVEFSTAAAPYYTFSPVGNYSISLTITNDGGYSNTSTQTAWVNLSVQPQVRTTFTASNTTFYTPPGVTKFTPQSIGFAADSFQWNFGDGFTSTETSPSHAYTTPGLYTVSLVSFRSDNLTNTNTTTVPNYINVTYSPFYIDPNFVGTPTSGSPGLLVSFTDLTSVGNGTATKTCNWSFGDSLSTSPFSSSCGNVQHVYAYAGVYDVNLSVTMFGNTSYELKQQYVVISSGQNSNIVWSPTGVAIQVLDANYNPITGIPVHITAYSSSLPGGLSGAVSYFSSTYGLTLASASQMLNSSTTYDGTTDDYGFVSTQVVNVIQYRIITEDVNGVNVTRLLWPAGPYYQIVTENATVYGIAAQARAQNTIYQNSIFNTTYWQPNSTFSCMGILVYDSTGATTNVSAWWTIVDNSTTWWTNSTFIGGYGPVNSSKCVPHVPYQRWKWGGITG